VDEQVTSCVTREVNPVHFERRSKNLPAQLLASFLLKFVMLLAVVSVAPPAFPQLADTTACSSPEYLQFDFWIGDWDVYDVGSDTRSARVQVDRILNGCVLRERYQDTNGMHGESFTIYDARRG
jgi:hypothetical protein